MTEFVIVRDGNVTALLLYVPVGFASGYNYHLKKS